MLDSIVEERHTRPQVQSVAKPKVYTQPGEWTEHTYTPRMCIYTHGRPRRSQTYTHGDGFHI